MLQTCSRRYSGVPLILIAALTACAPEPPPVHPFDQDMNHILGALDQTGAVRFPMVREGSVLPAEMNRPVNWRWQGPLDEGVRLVAKEAGYQVDIPACSTFPTITIDQSNATLGSLLDEMASASSQAAVISVDVPHHAIRITCNA